LALTSAQIVTQALAIARAPGFTTLAGQWLNLILAELCETYDFAVALQTGTITLSTGGGPPPTPSQGSGPYSLPANYLRMANNEVWYYVNLTPYVMVSIDLSEFDALVQQAGISNYPEYFATDISQSPPVMYVWPPSGGSYTLNIRYYSQIADITTPETSAAIPWFPQQNYLITRLAGEMMKITDDQRYSEFLGDGPNGAQGILNRYLKLQADDEGRAKTVKLDRRRFGTSFNRVPNTKISGW
jgi:hypothetical protein